MSWCSNGVNYFYHIEQHHIRSCTVTFSILICNLFCLLYHTISTHECFYPKQGEHTWGRGKVDGQRRPRQVASSPVSEPAVGGRSPRGAKLPARLPQPHLGQGDWQGQAVGSALVHSALSLTRCTSFHHLVLHTLPRIQSHTLSLYKLCSESHSLSYLSGKWAGAGRTLVFWAENSNRLQAKGFSISADVCISMFDFKTWLNE